MPRFVRNWWVEVWCNGKKVATGPSDSYGGIRVQVFQRDRGQVIRSFELDGEVEGPNDSRLNLRVNGPDGSMLAEHITER